MAKKKDVKSNQLSSPSQSLISCKSQFEQAIKGILESAYYNAEISTLTDSGPVQSIYNMVDREVSDMAEKKAKEFSESAAGPLTESIYNFIMSLQIIVNSTMFISPPGVSGGPCAGVGSTTNSMVKLL